MSLAAVFGASNATRACMRRVPGGACGHPVAGVERIPRLGTVDLCPTHLAEARAILEEFNKEKALEVTKSQRIVDAIQAAGTALHVRDISTATGLTIESAEGLCSGLVRTSKLVRTAARTYGTPKNATVEIGTPILQISGRPGHYSAEMWPGEYKTHRRVQASELPGILALGVRAIDPRIVVLWPSEQGGYCVVGDSIATQGDTLAAAAEALVEALAVGEEVPPTRPPDDDEVAPDDDFDRLLVALGLSIDLSVPEAVAAIHYLLNTERQASATLRDQLAAVRAELDNEQATSTGLRDQVAAAHAIKENLAREVERSDLLEGERADLQRIAAARGDALDAIRREVGGEEIDVADLAAFVAQAIAGAVAHTIPSDGHRIAYLEGWQTRQREIDALTITPWTQRTP